MRSSALRLEGEECTGGELVTASLLFERPPPVCFLVVLDEEGLTGVVVDFDLAMASWLAGEMRSRKTEGIWDKRIRQYDHQQRQQPTFSDYGGNR